MGGGALGGGGGGEEGAVGIDPVVGGAVAAVAEGGARALRRVLFRSG